MWTVSGQGHDETHRCLGTAVVDGLSRFASRVRMTVDGDGFSSCYSIRDQMVTSNVVGK